MDSRRSSTLYARSSASSSRSDLSPLINSIATWAPSVDELPAPAAPAVLATVGTRTPPDRIQYLSPVTIARGGAVERVASDSLNRHVARRNAREGRSESIDNLSVLYEVRDSNSHLPSSSGSRASTSAASMLTSQRKSSTDVQPRNALRLTTSLTQQRGRSRSLPNVRQPATRRPSFHSLYYVTPPARLPVQRSMPNLRAPPQGALSMRPASRASTPSSTHRATSPVRQPASSAGSAIAARFARSQRRTSADGSSPAGAGAPVRVRRRTHFANGLSRVTRGLSDRLFRRNLQ